MSGRDEPEPCDDALARAAREGSVRAFEALLDRHQGRVLRTLRLLGVPSQDRDDVAQEVFIRVFRHIGGYRPGRSFPAWLYRVTVNASHDYRRRRGRIAVGEAAWPDGLELSDDGGEGVGNPPDERIDLRRALERALETLTERERAVFVLRELEGLESSEVARALGVSSITVRRHLGLARRRMRRALAAIEKKTSDR